MMRQTYIFIAMLCLLISISLYILFSSFIKNNHKEPPKILTIYTWLDFIPFELQKKFETETGIKLQIDYIDSDEGLEAKLLTGKSEYDIVYPSTPYIFRHIELGLYRPLDLNKIPNIVNIDSNFLNDFTVNKTIYSVPYLWGTSGFAYDLDIVQSLFPGETINSWEYIFDPDKLKLIASKGVAVTSSANELFCAIGLWQGRLPETHTEHFIHVAHNYAQHAQPYWRVLLSSEAAIPALGSGEVSIAAIWNGDAVVAQKLGHSQGRNIKYVVPKEGALKWIDSLAIPQNSPNPDMAYKFINFLVAPENMAVVTNYVQFANTSSFSKRFIRSEILQNPILYPDDSVMQRLVLDRRVNQKFEHTINRHFFKILVGY